MTHDQYIEGMLNIFGLFNSSTKKSAEKLARDLTITSKDLFHIIMAGKNGVLEPYRYACHFSQFTPQHLLPTEIDHARLSASRVGPHTPGSKKLFNKISGILKDRRIFAAHLFYTPSHEYWHLIYFTQRDTDPRNNHWKIGGPHIHYSRESFCNEPMSEIWRAVCSDPPKPPGSIHIRYKELSSKP